MLDVFLIGSVRQWDRKSDTHAHAHTHCQREVGCEYRMQPGVNETGNGLKAGNEGDDRK